MIKATTMTALRSILDADPVRTQADRELIIKCLGLGETETSSELPEKVLTYAQAAKLLGRSKRAVHTLARRNVLRKVTFPGGQRSAGVLASDLNKLLKDSTSMKDGVE